MNRLDALTYTLIDPDGDAHPFGLIMSGGICDTVRSILRHGFSGDRAFVRPVSFVIEDRPVGATA